MDLFLLLFGFNSLLLAEAITPLPFSVNINKNKVLLGKKLFSNTILSKDNTVSCATYHNLKEGGDDGLLSSLLESKDKEDGITKENIANAIAEFEKMLITPNAPFDKFLKGDKTAISRLRRLSLF